MSGARWFGLVVGGLLFVFGGYILYEKLFVSLFTGQTHERVGLVTKDEDAFSFWLTTSVYGVCASMVVVAGAALIFLAIRPKNDDGSL